MTISSDNMNISASDGSSAEMIAVVAHLTKTAQTALCTNQDLRRRLAEAETLVTAHLQVVYKLEAECARAEHEAETRALITSCSENNVRVLSTALAAARKTCECQDTLLAELLDTWCWRNTAPWRKVRQLWQRTTLHRGLRQKLAGHFHTSWFIKEYPAVLALEEDPFSYFMVHGLARDLKPNPCFDMRWYLRNNPDIAKAGLHPLIHFQAHGFDEGRDPHPFVSCGTYRVRYEAGWLQCE